MKNKVLLLLPAIAFILCLTGFTDAYSDQFTQKALMFSLETIKTIYPSSELHFSDSLYSFEGECFIHMCNEKTVSCIEKYKADALSQIPYPRYSEELNNLLRNTESSEESSSDYKVGFSIPFDGMLTVRVSPLCYCNCKKESLFLFLFDQNTGDIYHFARIIKPDYASE